MVSVHRPYLRHRIEATQQPFRPGRALELLRRSRLLPSHRHRCSRLVVSPVTTERSYMGRIHLRSLLATSRGCPLSPLTPMERTSFFRVLGKGLEGNLEFTFERNTGILPVLGGGRPDRPDHCGRGRPPSQHRQDGRIPAP